MSLEKLELLKAKFVYPVNIDLKFATILEHKVYGYTGKVKADISEI